MASLNTPICKVFSMLGIELYELTEQLGTVEVTLQDCLLESSTLNAAAVTQLQAIDLISQTLSAISGFALSLSTLVPEHFEVDIEHAANQILLSELAARLQGSDTLQSGLHDRAAVTTGLHEEFE